MSQLVYNEEIKPYDLHTVVLSFSFALALVKR